MIIEKIINEKQKNPTSLRISLESETLELLLESSKIDKINVKFDI